MNKKENSVGIQLMGIMLANKISPFKPGCGVDIERYVRIKISDFSPFRSVFVKIPQCGIS